MIAVIAAVWEELGTFLVRHKFELVGEQPDHGEVYRTDTGNTLGFIENPLVLLSGMGPK